MKINKLTLGALGLTLLSACRLLPAHFAVAQSTTIYTNQNLRTTGIAKGRYELFPASKQFKVAIPNPIGINMHDTNVHAAHITLRYVDDKGESTGVEGFSELVFKYHDDGSRYFNIMPQKVGKMQIVITVMFEDGKIEIEKIEDAEVIAGKN